MIYICDKIIDNIVYEVYQGTSGTIYFTKK